jgi:hypothetical protein
MIRFITLFLFLCLSFVGKSQIVKTDVFSDYKICYLIRDNKISLIDTFYTEITQTFVYRDKIIIMTKEPEIHRGSGVDGIYYTNYFYTTENVKIINNLTKKYSGFEGDRGTVRVIFRYKMIENLIKSLDNK